MRNLVEALPIATVLIDDDDRVVGWNRAASALYGWQSHETVTMTMASLVDGADWAEWTQVRSTAKDDGLWRGNFRVMRRDGVALVSSFIAVPVVTDEVATMAWIATDVTDQALADQDRGAVLTTERLMREELETALGLVEALLDSLPLGLATFDVDLRCTRTNSTFDRILEGDEDPVGRHVDDLGLPPAAVGHLRRVVATGRAVLGRTMEVYLVDDVRHVTEYAFPIFAEGRVSGVGTAWVDDTAAQRVEKERQILERQAEDAHDRLAVLAAASSILATATDVDSLIDRLSRTLAPSAAEWCMIELIEPGGRADHVAVAHRDPHLARRFRDSVRGTLATADDDSPIGVVYRGARAVAVGPEKAPLVLHARPGVDSDGLYHELGFTSALVVPIRGRGSTIGVLCLANSSRARLTDDDLDLAIEVAQRAALAVGRAITYLEEHALAEQLQRALLPAQLPEIAQLDIDVRYRAAAQAATVGGDWYDAFLIGEARVCLCIGDVFGHDTRAAVGMGRVRTLVNAFATEEAAAAGDGWPDLDTVLRRTEQCIAGDSDAWGSCLLAVIDVESGELRIANAGHPPAVLIREQAAQFLDAEPGGVLGLNSSAPRTTSSWSLRGGDRLLLYTDGLVERRDEPLDVGLSRLLGASGLDAVGSSSFCDAVLHAMTAAHEPEDDIALFSAHLEADR